MANIIKELSSSEMFFVDAVSGITLLDAENEVHGWIAYSAKFGLVPHHHLGPVLLAKTIFNRTLDRKIAQDVPILFNHDMNQVIAKNVGHFVDKVGLKYNAEVIRNDDESFRIYNKIKQGAITQNSVGLAGPMKIVKGEAIINGVKQIVPKITEARLHHHSVAAVGAHPDAKIEAVFSDNKYALQNHDSLEISPHDLDSQPASDSQTSAPSLALLINAEAEIMRAVNARFRKQNRRGNR